MALSAGGAICLIISLREVVALELSSGERAFQSGGSNRWQRTGGGGLIQQPVRSSPLQWGWGHTQSDNLCWMRQLITSNPLTPAGSLTPRLGPPPTSGRSDERSLAPGRPGQWPAIVSFELPTFGANKSDRPEWIWVRWRLRAAGEKSSVAC